MKVPVMLMLSMVPGIALVAEAAPRAVVKPAAPTGAAVLKPACQSCHALTMVTEARHTPAEWGQVVQRMRANGAELTDAEARSVSVYLATTYPAK